MQEEINKAIRLFVFEGANIRVATDANGEPWFVVKDICEYFGDTNYRRAVNDLDDDEKGVSQMTTPGGQQQLSVVNEAGFYTMLLRMRPTKARGVSEEYIKERQDKLRRFRRWVTGEVLPAIRKTGGYIAAKPEDPPEVIMAKALKVADATISEYKLRLENAHKQIAELKPAAQYTEKVLSATNLHTVKSIGVHLGVSAKKLNDFLVAQDWIYKQGRIYYPTSKICGKGLCDYQINAYVADPYTKEVRTREHLKWTEKGRQAVIRLWNEAHGVLDFGG